MSAVGIVRAYSRRNCGTLELSEKVHCSTKRLTRLVRLNYLAPDIIASILDGTQPAELTGKKLMSTDLPMDWDLQRRIFGFPIRQDFLREARGW